MATDQKISSLTELQLTDVLTADYLPVVDMGASPAQTKKLSISTLLSFIASKSSFGPASLQTAYRQIVYSSATPVPIVATDQYIEVIAGPLGTTLTLLLPLANSAAAKTEKIVRRTDANAGAVVIVVTSGSNNTFDTGVLSLPISVSLGTVRYVTDGVSRFVRF